MEKTEKKKSALGKLRRKAEKRRNQIRVEIRRSILENYLLTLGWKKRQIKKLESSVKVNFWCGIGYSKAIGDQLHLSSEERAMTWTLVHRYAKAHGES